MTSFSSGEARRFPRDHAEESAPVPRGEAAREAPPLDRRDFLRVTATAAGGLLLALHVPRALQARMAEQESWQPNAFVQLDPDGTVTITIPRPDMGQGVRTSLAAIVAEELDVEWNAVRVAQADYHVTRYGDQYSGGSSSVRNGWDLLGGAGAVARAMLVAAAAAQWQVPLDQCGTERGSVVHRASARRLPYGSLASAAARMPVPADAARKAPNEYRIIGTRLPSLDAPAIVRGAAHFGIDVRLPGLLFASIERSPRLGARVATLEDAAARRLPGVRAVVRIDADAMPSFGGDNPRPSNGVGVIATSTWAAMQGRRALRITWTPGPGADESTSRLREEAIALSTRRPERLLVDDGDVDAAFQRAARVIEAAYEVPLLTHAPMEPMNAVADCRDGRCTVWAPIQNPAGAHLAIAKATGLAADAITVHVTRSGGAFGRRFYADYVVEAVMLSRAVEAPVQVVWAREDDVRHGFYRPAGYHVLRAGLDPDGRVLGWSHHLVNAPRGEFLEWMPNQPFPAGAGELDEGDFPALYLEHFRLGATRLASRIPLGQWRAVDSSATIFPLESFVDELAHAAARDPLAFKLELLSQRKANPPRKFNHDPARVQAVFRLAAERAGWGSPLAAGRGRGIAGAYNNHAYVAQVAEVSVTPDGGVRVERIVAAVDCGRVINTSGASAQVEGAVLQGLSAALGERITVEGGSVQQSNFHDYRVLRIQDAPRVEAVFVQGDSRPLGLGEAALPAVAPAVANAIFAATGRRVRALPLRA